MGEQKKIPTHVGFIMDGNRRWAVRNKLQVLLVGHTRGYEKVKAVARWCKQRGISVVTVYGFSQDNWTRPPDEVKYLMQLFRQVFSDDVPELIREGVRLKIIGDRDDPRIDDVEPGLAALIPQAEAKTAAAGGDLLLQVAFNYDGRSDLVQAYRRMLAAGIGDEVSEELIDQHLWTAGVPDPDLVIRTSGEQRLSSFLIWQSEYSELQFPETLWPDFSEQDLDKALTWYATRERRRGGRPGKSSG